MVFRAAADDVTARAHATCAQIFKKSRSFVKIGGGNLRERDHFEDPGVRWEDNSKMDLQEVGHWHGLDRAGSG